MENKIRTPTTAAQREKSISKKNRFFYPKADVRNQLKLSLKKAQGGDDELKKEKKSDEFSEEVTERKNRKPN